MTNGELPRTNLYDDATYEVLKIIGSGGPCRCFMLSPIWDGHDVVPPCDTVVLARQIVDAVRKADS
jgi:hypothetical protein